MCYRITLVFLAERANAIGSLKTYEANVREADPKLLRVENHSCVPSIDAIRTAKSDYNKNYRFDNEPVQDLLIFQQQLVSDDKDSENLKGLKKYHFLVKVDDVVLIDYIQAIQHISFFCFIVHQKLLSRGITIIVKL